MTNEIFMHAQFYQSIGNIDIWRTQDTKAGTTTYFIWNDGTLHERSSEKEIINLAKFIVNTRRSK